MESAAVETRVCSHNLSVQLPSLSLSLPHHVSCPRSIANKTSRFTMRPSSPANQHPRQSCEGEFHRL